VGDILQYTRATLTILYALLAFYLGRRAYLNHLGSNARRWLMSLLCVYFGLDAIREGWATVAWVVYANGSAARVIDDFWYPLLAVATVAAVVGLLVVWRRTDGREGVKR
jgi:hypothetical protein